MDAAKINHAIPQMNVTVYRWDSRKIRGKNAYESPNSGKDDFCIVRIRLTALFAASFI